MPAPKTHWRQVLADYFTFSRSQRRAIAAICTMLCAWLVWQWWWMNRNAPPADADPPFSLHEIAALRQQLSDSGRQSGYRDGDDEFRYRAPREYDRQRGLIRPNLFPFDPNTASEAELLRLGLAPRTVQTWLKYREKGGKFRKPGDLRKLYTLPAEDAELLIPYVRIAGEDRPIAVRQPSEFERKESAGGIHAIIDINRADTTEWKSLPGIGSRLAARIVNFRDKLGGFHSIEQVGETWYLPDSTFRQIRPRLKLGQGGIRQIDINTATEAELQAHPYLRWQDAKVIVRYREQHGPYRSTEDLRNLHQLADTTLLKVLPYLTTGSSANF